MRAASASSRSAQTSSDDEGLDEINRGISTHRVQAVTGRAWVSWALIALFFLVLSGVLTARYVYVHSAISPIDESNYIQAVHERHGGSRQ